MIDRRELFRRGGLGAAALAVLAACGDSTGPTAAGRIGVAAPPATLPSVDIDDVVLLRTAQSLHHIAVEVHTRVSGHEAFPTELSDAVQTIIDNHVERSEQLGSLIEERGGVAYACPNEFWMERFVEPAFAATDGSDDVGRDLLHISTAFEEIIARSHQALVTSLAHPSLRTPVLQMGLEGTRQAAYLASLLPGEHLIEPTMLGDEGVESDDDGFPIRYLIPDQFGQVGGISLVVGAVDPEDAVRFSVSLQTPADNSFVYEHLACS